MKLVVLPPTLPVEEPKPGSTIQLAFVIARDNYSSTGKTKKTKKINPLQQATFDWWWSLAIVKNANSLVRGVYDGRFMKALKEKEIKTLWRSSKEIYIWMDYIC